MSWLSKGLQKLGVSRDVQRKLTKPVLVAAAPFTGGASTALIPFVGKPGGGSPSPAQTAVEAVAQQKPGGDSAQVSAIIAGFEAVLKGQAPTAPVAPVGTPEAPGFFQRYGTPIAIGGAALVVGGVGFYALTRK